MGFWKELKKATKDAIREGHEDARKRIAEERKREAEEEERRRKTIDQRLERAAKAYEGRLRAPRIHNDYDD